MRFSILFTYSYYSIVYCYHTQNKTLSRLTEMSEERKVNTCTIVEHEELREQLSLKEMELSELRIEHDRLREQYERMREENYKFEVCTQMYYRNSIINSLHTLQKLL